MLLEYKLNYIFADLNTQLYLFEQECCWRNAGSEAAEVANDCNLTGWSDAGLLCVIERYQVKQSHLKLMKW